ncbi:uncharacterized protein Tco025E_02340 [Trypanosoma conorhini]|uniref:Uncharacterized protein n=1 Tax=Trypanosoma conorhini TaxID=83891 RepID=A0A3S5IUA9_9TRYP|nr:uncharacterized protein Tco025E_02340 [Trypanosoma conorhini]RNF25107.1 hypothetical protein Tco025E_02340 [Trypanosoma conorhini]
MQARGLPDGEILRRRPSPTPTQEQEDVAPAGRKAEGGAASAFRLPRQDEIVPEERELSSEWRQGADMTCLMEKLLEQKRKMQTMEEVLDDLHRGLFEVRDAARKASPKQRPHSCGAASPPQNGNADRRVGGEVWYFEESRSAPHASRDGLNWSAAEMQAWKAASLPQLFSMRERLLSSLCGVSDAITRKRLSEIKSYGALKDAQRETDAAIQASMHRLFGEAFCVASLGDAKDLCMLAERVKGSGMASFDRAVFEIKQLTQRGGLLNSCEMLQTSLRPNSPFAGCSRGGRYLRAMRNLLLAFAVDSRGNKLLHARRTELEAIASQEMVHAALLCAAQGRNMIPHIPFCLFGLKEFSNDRALEQEPQRRARAHTPSAGHATSGKQRPLQLPQREVSQPALACDGNGPSSPADSLPLRLHSASPVRGSALRNPSLPSRRRGLACVSRTAPATRRAAEVSSPRSIFASSPILYQTPEARRQVSAAASRSRMRTTPLGRKFSTTGASSAEEIQMLGTAVQLTVSTPSVEENSPRQWPIARQHVSRHEAGTILPSRVERRVDSRRAPAVSPSRWRVSGH